MVTFRRQKPAGSKDTLRNAMLSAVDGSRLVKFNELEATDVWRGVKGLSNREEQSGRSRRRGSIMFGCPCVLSAAAGFWCAWWLDEGCERACARVPRAKVRDRTGL